MKEIRSRPASRYAAIGGTGAILATAWMAFIQFAAMRGFHMEPIDWILLTFVLILVVGGTIAMKRFIRLHGDQIGEARFDTSHPDDPAG